MKSKWLSICIQYFYKMSKMKYLKFLCKRIDQTPPLLSDVSAVRACPPLTVSMETSTNYSMFFYTIFGINQSPKSELLTYNFCTFSILFHFVWRYNIHRPLSIVTLQTFHSSSDVQDIFMAAALNIIKYLIRRSSKCQLTYLVS